MELMADNFPGVFSGYTMDVVESHQSSKADTSGTARAVVQSFQRMGVDYPEVGRSSCAVACWLRMHHNATPALWHALC